MLRIDRSKHNFEMKICDLQRIIVILKAEILVLILLRCEM